MHDPREGITPDGLIRTGATRDAIAPVWAPVLDASADAVAGRASLYAYGSVATGCAAVPTSDLDLLSIGLPADEAARISAGLSVEFRETCRDVTIAPAAWGDLEADNDEGYGLRVFLRHYCVHLTGDDPADDLPAYPADVRAARGFNGDIARHLHRWQSEVEADAGVALLGTRIARKTLLAVAGLVSVRDATWSTDRRACAARWNELEPGMPVATLLAWLHTPPRDRAAIRRVLGGPVAYVVQSFESEIGLWDMRDADPSAGPSSAPYRYM
jgi:hypothetical protein